MGIWITHKVYPPSCRQASPLLRYSTHAVNTPLPSALVRLDVHFPDLFYMFDLCSLLTVTLQIPPAINGLGVLRDSVPG